MAFLNPIPYLGSGPLGPLTPGSPAPMMGVNMSMAHRLPNNQIVGGPFGGIVHPGGVPMLSSGGNLVVVSGFGGGSVSRFNLSDAQDKFKNLIKDLKNPTCVINKPGGMAIWYDGKYTHTFNDTSVNNTPAPGGAMVDSFLTTTVNLVPGTTVFTGNGISVDTVTNRLSVSSDTLAHNYAILSCILPKGQPIPLLFNPASRDTNWGNSASNNKNLINENVMIN